MDTLADVLQRLSAAGYTDEVEPGAGGLVCSEADGAIDIDTIVVDEIVRLEGDSDPDDELIVFALTWASGAGRGTFTAKFGPDTSPEESALIHRLSARHP